MATAHRRPATTAKRPRRTSGDRDRARESAMQHLQHASDDIEQACAEIDKARQDAAAPIRRTLDSTLARLREVSADLRQRADDQTAEWQDALEHATDTASREMGRRAIRAQRTPEALTELSREIRNRRAELVPPTPKGNGAKAH